MTVSQINTAQMRPFGDGREIVRIGPDQLPAAAARLVALGSAPDAPAGDRFLAFAQENQIPLDCFFGMVDARGRISGSALGVPNAGKTAMLFASRPAAPAGAAGIAALIDEACRQLHRQGVRLAQTLLETRERAERAIYEDAGFEFLATLSYLQRQSAAPLPKVRGDWPDDITLESWRDDLHDDFLDALDQSYEETLDCPRLTGLRRAEEILAGHRATGRFDPSMWTLLRTSGRPAGVLLLNPSARQESIELVYLGLARQVRGRGLGMRLLHHGLCLASARPEHAMALAVDERNSPAMRLYHRAGFRRLLRRIALIRPLAIPS